jgi:hypothetical protein
MLSIPPRNGAFCLRSTTQNFDGGWSSDDIKTFDKDRGREGNTHTHTHCSLLGKVVSFLL